MSRICFLYPSLGCLAYVVHEAYIQEEDIPTLSDDTNLSAKDALSGPDSIKWRKAMEEEMKALLKNGTWTLVEPPKDRQIIGSNGLTHKAR